MLHYLMTGNVFPVGSPGDLLLTGEDVGEDLGYGPARLHSESATQAFSRFLDAQDVARLQEVVDLKDMSDARVYGVPFWSRTRSRNTRQNCVMRLRFIFRGCVTMCGRWSTRATASWFGFPEPLRQLSRRRALLSGYCSGSARSD